MPCFVIDSYHIQAKRKNSRYRGSEIANQMHAGQIYAEMLGQVCHRKQYMLNLKGQQEVYCFSLSYHGINHRPFFFMRDMRHFTSFMLHFLIHIFVTFTFTGQTTNFEYQRLKR